TTLFRSDFDEDARIARQRDELLKLLRTVDGAIGHVVDDDGEIRALLNEMNEVRDARDGRIDLHGHMQRLGTLPQGRHERTIDPIAAGVGCGADTNSVKSLSREF